jgi:2-keto-3-deoxy-L-rhamnonate aldolase RhmA
LCFSSVAAWAFNSIIEYVNTSNENLAVVIQIEHIDAVKNIEEIIKVSGIDCLFIGPYDLSASMGKVGKLTPALSHHF